MPIQKNVAFTLPFLSTTTAGAANTATTPTIMLSLDSDAETAATNAPTHVGGGRWKVALTQAEMNHDQVSLLITGSGLTPSHTVIVTEASYTNALAVLLNNNGKRAEVTVPGTVLLPVTGTATFHFDLYVYDGATLTATDSLPTVTLTNVAGTDRAGRLGSVTSVSTGHYRVAYTATFNDTVEQLKLEFSFAIGGTATKAGRAVAILGPVQIEMTQMLALDYTDGTVGKSLLAAYAGIFGNKDFDTATKTATVKSYDNTLVLHTMAYDSNTAPTYWHNTD